MTRRKLCLGWAVVGCLATAFGCESQIREGDDSGVVLFGRVAGEYTVCFNLSSDVTRLEPSVVCDPEGQTPYSFNILVETGTDDQGDPCGPFNLPFEQPLAIQPDGTFVITQGDVTVQATLTSGGSVETGTGQGSAVEQVGTAGTGGDAGTGGTGGSGGTGGGFRTCEVMWEASTSAPCFEEAAERCNLLQTCCESIYLLPPFAAECQAVVNACDPDACDETLAGYVGCQQPPICTPQQDLFGVCTFLNNCCNTIDLTKSELETCLATAQACQPPDCVALINDYPDCEFPEP